MDGSATSGPPTPPASPRPRRDSDAEHESEGPCAAAPPARADAKAAAHRAKDGPSPANTVLVFDWDDTLFPSTWATKSGLLDRACKGLAPTAEQASMLCALEASVERTLRIALGHGRVCIITNAELGWVQRSTATFMPRVWLLLQHVRIVSARHTFERVFPGFPAMWKNQAFLTVLGHAYGDARGCRNVLSVGDSVLERDALYFAASGNRDMLCKSIKLREQPGPDLVCRQLDMVVTHFHSMVVSPEPLDLMLATVH